MRVIAGTAKGIKLKTPRGSAVRPTSGRVKKALFDILSPSISGAQFWDLYAGSGAIGIEALSRGAATVQFVEKEKAHLKIIKENLSRAKLTARASLIGKDVRLALSWLALKGQQANFIYTDPPYQGKEIPKLLEAVERHKLLHANGLIILELFSGHKLWPDIHPAVTVRQYGDTILAFIKSGALSEARAALNAIR